MDREIAIDDDRNLSRLVQRAEDGENVVLTREGKVVARIVSNVTATQRDKSVAAMERILEIGEGISLGGLRFKDLINEGRKY